MQKHLIFNDLHFPFVDKKALKALWKFMHAVGPFDGIHILGDLVDFDMLSTFPINVDRHDKLNQDLQEVTSFLGELHTFSLYGNSCNIIMSEGNHESRLEKYCMRRAPEISRVRGLTVPELLGLDDFGIDYHTVHQPYQIASLWLTHGDVIRTHSGYTAKAMMDRVRGNVMHGHSHRFGAHYERTLSDLTCAWENGCLCRLDQPYLKSSPNWQQGWSLVTTFGKRLFQVEQVLLLPGYKYAFRGDLK